MMAVGGACLLAHANGMAFDTWTEQMTCGQAQYRVDSVCTPSNDPETLNDCKAQTLVVKRPAGPRSVRLPELTVASARTIREAGGEVKDLFLTHWACTRKDTNALAIFYYSIGGGSAPYSEATAVYDAAGKLLDDNDPKARPAAGYPFGKMKPVRSIMPDAP